MHQHARTPAPAVTRAGAALLAAGLTAAVGAAVVGAAPSSQAAAPAASAVRIHPSPSHFTHGRVDNPWFPLKPGTRWVYRGVSGRTAERDVMIATYRTKVVDGVTCRVVLDRVFSHGRVSERTHDWYAQTKAGTVWYFGENTTTYDAQGHPLSHEGSFASGVDGAEAGIFMTAHPHSGPTYHQESYPGHAEDEFTVLRRGAHVSTPLLASGHALLTKEFTPLEPGVIDHKYYVRDIGEVHEETVHGPTEGQSLVSLTHLPRP